MFGWVEYRKDGKYKRENRMKNSIFHCLVMGRKSEEWKTREKLFSPGPTKTFLPTREKLPHYYFTVIPIHVTSFIPSTYPAEDFCPPTLIHTLLIFSSSTPSREVQVLLSCFFFQRDLLFPVACHCPC